MRLTEHFTLEELTNSQTASRLRLDNTPSAAIMINLRALADALELVRAVLNSRPILISSGYRSPPVNKAVGGVSNSAHLNGLAVDFICPGYGSPLQICEGLDASALNFDQVIQEGTWVHYAIAAAGRMPRHQVLTAHFSNAGPATYTAGLGGAS